jgi:hypothetical protein
MAWGGREVRPRAALRGSGVRHIAYHFHWPLDDILDLEHPLRLRFVDEIGRINQRLSEG